MKKKFFALVTVVALVISALAVTGCNWSEVTSIWFVTPPATTYSLNESAGLDFTIGVQTGNGETTYSYKDNTGVVVVDNFYTTSIGTRTATVIYDGKLKLSFTYTVVGTDFAGGSGSQNDPYIVSTPHQFQNLLNQKTFNYYKLSNSINFKDYTLKMANNAGRHDDVDGKPELYAEGWAGYIDGANYSLLNICTVLTPAGNENNKYNELFGTIGSKKNGGFTMKNLTVNFAASNTNAPAPGLAFTNGLDAEILFENVTLTGFIDYSYSSNSAAAPFISYPNRGEGNHDKTNNFKSLTFKKCTNNMQMLNTYSVTAVGGFIATMAANLKAPVTFEDCVFNGRIEGAKNTVGVGIFVGDNTSSSSNLNNTTFTNCTIGEEAKVIKTSQNIMYGAFAGGGVAWNLSKEKIEDQSTQSYVDTSLKSLTVTNNDNASLTVTLPEGVDGSKVTYRVFGFGGMRSKTHGEGTTSTGGFTFEMPVLNKTNVETGEGEAKAVTGATFPLYKVQLTEGTVNKEGAQWDQGVYVLRNDILNYYGQQVCYFIKVGSTKLTVIAYDEAGKAVAWGVADKVDLEA